MNLYRLDYIDAEGRAIRACTNNVGMDYLTRHAVKAREDAKRFAREGEQDVSITRISGGGRMKVTAIANPQGSIRRP